MSKNTTKQSNIQATRDHLLKLSHDARSIKAGKVNNAQSLKEALFFESQPLNYYLLNFIYETNGATDFKTFHQWKDLGATIKKGEKAFIIWGQPIKDRVKDEQTGEITETEPSHDSPLYFPLCYLFSNLQVITAKEKKEASEQHSTPDQQPELVEATDLDDYL